MKKIDFKTLILTCIFCLAAIFVGLWQYDALPEQVAIHFDVNNNPNNYFNKAVFVFGMPIFMVLMQVFVCVTVDLTDKHKEANKKFTGVAKWLLPVILFATYIITIVYNLGVMLDIRVWVFLLLGVMFIVLGNYLPKTVGTHKWPQRTFTEKVQRRINQIAGYVTVAYGVLFMLSTFFHWLISLLMIAFYIIFVVALMFYGWRLDKKERKEMKEKEEKQ